MGKLLAACSPLLGNGSIDIKCLTGHVPNSQQAPPQLAQLHKIHLVRPSFTWIKLKCPRKQMHGSPQVVILRRCLRIPHQCGDNLIFGIPCHGNKICTKLHLIHGTPLSFHICRFFAENWCDTIDVLNCFAKNARRVLFCLRGLLAPSPAAMSTSHVSNHKWKPIRKAKLELKTSCM